MDTEDLALIVAALAAKGTKGPPGDLGERGPPGDRGEPGEVGERGREGLRGFTGSKGDRGPQGVSGQRGERGVSGTRGDEGPRGPQGDKGEKGDTGDRGPKGDKGDRGLRWRGHYQRGAGYAVDDAVEFEGSSWIMKAPGGNRAAPSKDSLFWDLLAKAGDNAVSFLAQAQAPKGGAGTWGTITGTLADQTDLQTALNGKDSLGAASSAVAAHEAASDPHPAYLKQAEGDVLYDALGAAAAAVAVHAAAADPHTGYQKESERGVAGGYASLDGAGVVPVAQTPVHQALSGAGTNTHAQIDTHLAAAAPHSGHEVTTAKNAASGYAGLSAGSKIAASQMSGVLASSDLTNDAALEKVANKAAASGYASLDSGTKVPTAQLGGAGADATKFLRGDQTWQAPTAATPDLVLTKRSATADQTVTAGYSAHVAGDYEIASGFVLELAANGIMEIT